MAESRRRRHYRQSSKAGPVLFVLALLVFIGVYIFKQVLVVKDVQISGLESYEATEVIGYSGIREGQSIFSIDENAVGHSLAVLGKLELVGLKAHYPNTIALTVKERYPAGTIRYLGVTLLLDGQGYVLDRLEEGPSQQLPSVQGIQFNQYTVGRKLADDSSQGFSAMITILDALREQDLSDRVKEINVGNSNNVSLSLREGFYVKLGNAENLRDKLIWMRGVAQDLLDQGIVSGTIDVSTGTSAIYIEPKA